MVAILLTVIVGAVLGGFVYKSIILHHDTPEYLATHWQELMALIIGGLIAYIASKSK